MLLKQHILLTYQRTHVNFICGLYKIFYKSVYKKFLSKNYLAIFFFFFWLTIATFQTKNIVNYNMNNSFKNRKIK
jgi:hypothetical protein